MTCPDTDDPAEQARLEAEAHERADTAYRRRSLTWRRQLDGSISGRFTLDPVGGQTFLTAISALSHQGDRGAGPRQAAAGVDGRALDPAETAGIVDPVADPRTRRQRYADALVTLATVAQRSGQLPDRGGVTRTLLVTTDLDALEGRVARAALLPYGGTLDRSACGASPARRRLFTPAQRRAIAVRDKGCVQPGSDAAPIECDAHHAIPCYDGGSTDLDNGYLLCAFDHQRHHREGWTIHRDQNGNPHVTPHRLSIRPSPRDNTSVSR